MLLHRILYRKLHKKLSYLSSEEKLRVYHAYKAALEWHSNQRRDSGEQYITHPLAVAEVLAGMSFDYQTIIAALLHDVVEDTAITKENLAKEFGEVVAELVDGVTKLSKIGDASNIAENQAQSFRKMMLAISKDIRVVIIKLADRLHNMQTIDGVSTFKRKRVAKETFDVYAPIAHRFGMYDIYVELEDLAFKALYPRRYRILKNSIDKLYGNHRGIIETLKKELEIACHKYSIEGSLVLGRRKHLYSIYKKMIERNISLASIMDIYGFRIVVRSVEDCYKTLGIVHSIYRPIHEKIKDYIAAPKFNGYQSLHTVLLGPYGAPVEIQIRTREMNQVATGGVAAHWAYKTSDEAVDKARLMAEPWITNILEAQHYFSNSLEFFEHIKMELYPNKVFVFTPKGEILELLAGSTAIDFAYAIHTDIGNSCVAVRINRSFLPLSTPLSNGQMVSIITSKDAEPNPGWLNFAITTRARHNIRTYLRSKRKEQLVVLGRQLLMNAFDDMSLDFHKIEGEILETFSRKANFEDIDSLYENIGLGNQLATFVAYQLVNNRTDSDNLNKPITKKLVINTTKGTAIFFANCCNPIPGDSIVGYLNDAHGLDIHIQDCPYYLSKLSRHLKRLLQVDWGNSIINEDFCVAVTIEVVNYLGVFAEVTKAISKANAHINSIHCDTNDGDYSTLNLNLLVKNRAHLQRIKRHISRIPAVIGVARRRTSDVGNI